MKDNKKTREYIERFCTGCGLCHSLYGINFSYNEKGFPVAQIDDDPSKYEQICPVFYYHNECKHDVWGNIQSALIGYSSNDETRFEASSGGALTEICSFLLETKLVDGIIHTTFDPEDSTRTITCLSKNPEEVKKRCGSRYSISSPLYNIKEYIEKDQKYAFVGKPCDVMALRMCMDSDIQLKNSIRYLLSFFCAGEPSVNAQNNLLQAIGVDRENCGYINYRGNGWPGYTTVIDKDGKKHQMEYKKAWGTYLGRDLRDICRFCMDGTGELADIVCADFWYLDRENKPDFSEHEGRNIIISRTQMGDELLKAAVDNGRIIVEGDFTSKIDSEFHLYQPAQYTRKGTMSSSLLILRTFGRMVPKYSKTFLKKYSSHVTMKVKAKYYIGTLKRIIKGRL